MCFRMGPRSTRDQNRNNFFRPEENHEVVDTWDNTIASSVVDQNKSDGNYTQIKSTSLLLAIFFFI